MVRFNCPTVTAALILHNSFINQPVISLSHSVSIAFWALKLCQTLCFLFSDSWNYLLKRHLLVLGSHLSYTTTVYLPWRPKEQFLLQRCTCSVSKKIISLDVLLDVITQTLNFRGEIYFFIAVCAHIFLSFFVT